MFPRIMLCLVLHTAIPGCQPDEYIPPATDARPVDSRPVLDGPVPDGPVPDASFDAPPGDAATEDNDASPADAGLTDASTVDATPPTYTHAADIQPVWNGNCSSASCHPTMTPDAYPVLVGTPSEVPGMNIVEPGSPEDSYLMHKLDNTHLAVGGSGESMPPGPLLKPDVRNMIRVWIQEGAPP